MFGVETKDVANINTQNQGEFANLNIKFKSTTFTVFAMAASILQKIYDSCAVPTITGEDKHLLGEATITTEQFLEFIGGLHLAFFEDSPRPTVAAHLDILP